MTTTEPIPTGMKPLSCIIDGTVYTAQRNQTILDVARAHGIAIPTLCYHPKLKPLGSCRLCLVEVQGTPTPVPACTTLVRDGMTVRTRTAASEALRRETLKLIFLRHPMNCAACEINGACQLQDLAHQYDINHTDLHTYSISGAEPESGPYSTPLIQYHSRRCILCGRCVQACVEITEVGAITFKGRGALTRIAPVEAKGNLRPECVSCGECMALCPVNALTEAMGKKKGKAWETRKVTTTCAYCGVGCQLELNAVGNTLTGVTAVDGGVNRGALCSKGRFGYEFVNHPERLTVPLIRENGTWRESNWDEALTLVATKLAEIRTAYGPDAIGALSSARCTNEENYLFQKFVRGILGTNNIDHCARLCHSSTVAGLAAAFGSGAMTNSIEEIEDTDVILITGSNTSENHPIIGRMVKRAVDRRRAKLIVVDPRQIPLVRFAHIWLRPTPGTDAAWINGLCHVILKEGLWNQDFVKERTEGFEAFRTSVEAFSPEVVERITGIASEDLRRAARLYAKAPKAMILYAMGITQHTNGTDNVKALANLVMLCGHVGREGTGLNPLRGQNNVQGACDMGALPHVLPGYQPVTDEEVLAVFQAEWATGVRLSHKVGLTVTQMFPAVLDGRLRAMYIVGENPALSDANGRHVRKALESLDFLVVQDIFRTETAEYAHVILPGASFAEKDGTFTNTERRVQRVRTIVNPPGRALPDWEIFCRLAKIYSQVQHRQSPRFGRSEAWLQRHRDMGYWDYDNPSQIFDDLAALNPSYRGISYRRLERGSLQWPCPHRHHPGTPYLHKDGFSRGRGLFHAVPYRGPAESPDEDYPFYLSTGRIHYHYHTGTMTRRCRGLDLLVPEERILLHPEDAERLGIESGERVRVVSRRGAVEACVEVSLDPQPGMVFATFHFSEVPINTLTNDALDPIAGIPEFKVCAVRVEKIGA